MFKHSTLTKKLIARAGIFGLSVAATLGIASEARAEANTHDGFYLQIQVGPGYYSMSAEQAGIEASYSGVTLASALQLGGSLAPGIVLGGTLVTDYAPSPSYEVNGNEPAGTPDFTQYVFAIGPFVDFYPNPNGGLHFQGMLGFGGVETSVDGNAGGNDPTGPVLAVGAGYEWWVGREWSIGAMGRFMYGAFSYEDVGFGTIAPALLATFTYH